MRHESQFRISHNPYAVDLTSLTGTLDSTALTPVYRGSLNAVWYRRIKGRITACTGQLWDFQTQQPANAEEFLARLTDGRTGGRCHARWNGVGYWADDQYYKQRDAHLAVLKPMLASYPDPPAGFDGWWRF